MQVNYKKVLSTILLLIAGWILFLYGLPFIFAFLTALLLEFFISKGIVTLKINRLSAVIMTFILYLFTFSMTTYLLITAIVKQIDILATKLPNLLASIDFYKLEEQLMSWVTFIESIPGDVVFPIGKTLESLKQQFIDIINALLEMTLSIPNFLVQVLIYLIALFLISLDLPKIKASLNSMISSESKIKLNIVFEQLNRAVLGFLKAQVLLSIITYLLAFIGLLILKIDYSYLLAFLIVIVDLLPILGTGSVLVPLGIYFMIKANYFAGIGLIVLFVVITVVRRAIEPKIMSNSLGIGPISTLISMFLGFKLFGLVGLFLGPLIVILSKSLVSANIIKLPKVKW